MLRVVVSNKDHISAWATGEGLPGDLDTRTEEELVGVDGEEGEEGRVGKGGEEGEKSDHLQGAGAHNQSSLLATRSSLVKLELPGDASLTLVLAADVLCYGFKSPQVLTV